MFGGEAVTLRSTFTKAPQTGLIQGQVDDNKWKWSEDGANNEAEEGKALTVDAKGVVVLKHPRRGDDKGIHETEKEATVGAYEGDDGLREQHVDRPNEQDRGEVADQSTGRTLGRRGAFNPQLFRPTLKDGLLVCFWCEQDRDVEGHNEEDGGILCPAPALSFINEPPNERAQNGTEKGDGVVEGE